MGKEEPNMKRKRLRIGSLVVLLALIAAIPASTQVLFGSRDGDAEGSNLSLLILVNRMELTAEQMEEIHGLLEGLLEEREALEVRRAELEEDMVAFAGTAVELDEILEAFRMESAGQVEAAREHVEEVIDQIKGVLTLKQGEVLAEVLPGLLGDRGASLPFSRQGRNSELGLRERLFEQLEERFTGNPEIIERLQQRLGGHERMMARSSRVCGQLGTGLQRSTAGVSMQVLAQRRGLKHRGLDWIEQLVEVLELKLEAIG
jgi:hypothetical protein